MALQEIMPAQTEVIQCAVCSKQQSARPSKREGVCLPRGWKRDAEGEVACPACWKSQYILRAVEFSVAGVVDAEWEELWGALKECWTGATNAANAAVLALLRVETSRTRGQSKLPKPPPIYLYKVVPPAAHGVDPASHVSLLRMVEAKYRSSRFGILWTGSVRPPLYQYPVPYPLPPAAWSASIGPGGEPLVEARFAGRRWTLKLRAGKEFSRQFKQLRAIVSGEAMGVEGSLRPGKNKGLLLLKLIAWFPRRNQRQLLPRGGIVRVTTGGDRFLCATAEHRDPWIVNADKVRQWIVLHERYRQRAMEDLKFEKRWPSAVRERNLAEVRGKCEKMRNRLESFSHEVTHSLAAFAARCGAVELHFDDTDKSYVPSFPWFEFREKLQYKLDEMGIRLVLHGTEPQPAGEIPFVQQSVG